MNMEQKQIAQARNQEAIALYQSGMAPKDIAIKQSRKASAIHSMLGKARQDGKLPRFKRRRHRDCNTYPLRHMLEKNNIGLGGIGPYLKHQISKETLEWIIDQTLAEGYESVAEYLCELAVEAFYENQHSAGKTQKASLPCQSKSKQSTSKQG